ncbi:MAG TPA: hypothetical protein VH189_15755, partial [Rhizomicrobium sp.]|nr:hypothetical protein [Rhizomicrobium sp.]
LVPRFRNSHELDIRLQANFGIGALEISYSWCRFGFEVRPELDIDGIANFETTTLGGRADQVSPLHGA